MYPTPGQQYSHYKGGLYEVITMSTHTETNEKLVIYKSINFGSIYARPYEVWNSDIEGVKRFILVNGN